MSISFFDTSIEFLKGVGPAKAKLLKSELNITTFGDLLNHFPFRYIDRSRFFTIAEANPDMPYIQLKVQVTGITTVGAKRTKRLVARIKDDTGSMELVWFQGVKWMGDYVKPGGYYVVFGKPSLFNGKLNIVHPEMEIITQESPVISTGLQAVYNTTEKLRPRGLDSRGLWRLMRTMLSQMPAALPETMSENLITKFKLHPLRDALFSVHMPSDFEVLQKAQFRLKFEELFYLQLRLFDQKRTRTEKYKGHKFSVVGNFFNTFYTTRLPFELTGAQKRVIKEIRADMGSGLQMNRMLQGDVGSGKTLVALMCMLIALDNSTQACLMVPTEILASQHFETISQLVSDMGIEVALLTGSTKSAKRKDILSQAADGTLHILIGTHALLEAVVQFDNLGLVIIDEQHRFGVEQRSRLWEKNNMVPHVLVMTATPIPRTLAMTLYGDLDVSVIDEMPPGRKPIQTIHRYEKARIAVFDFLRKEIALGRQVYIVYPLIEESEKMDYNDLMAGFESISRSFPLPQYQVSIVHGRMKAADKEYEMQRFGTGQTHIMVATTVIEVGVNVPNASIMLIESAERFGLSQMHQLRGRVGRGHEQSYCILMTSNKLTNESRERLATMVRTNDGFEIAEADLRLRGPGDLMGTQQSGMLDLRIADLSTDARILQTARIAAEEVITADPLLASKANAPLNRKLKHIWDKKGDWSKIS